MPSAVMFSALRTSAWRALAALISALLLTFGLPTLAQADSSAALTITPAALSAGPGETLTVSVEITNTGDDAAAGRVFILAPYEPITTVAQMTAWLDASVNTYAGEYLAEVAVPALAQGERATVSVDLPLSTARLGSTWGPRGLAASYQVFGNERATGRTSFVFTSGTAPAAATVSTVFAVVPPATTLGLLTEKELVEYTAATGILTQQVLFAQGRPVAVGLDPRILASIDVLGDAVPASVEQWLQLVRTLPNDTFVLPYADADISAQAQAGSATLLAPEQLVVTETSTPEPTATPVPAPVGTSFTPTLTGLAWPAASTVTGSNLTVFRDSGYERVVLSNTNVGADLSRGTTAGMPTVVTTEQLSAALAASDRSTAASLLAAAAVDPAAQGSMQAGIARGLATAELSRVGQNLDALTALSWVDAGRLSAVLSSVHPELAVVDHPESAERIATVATLLARNSQIAAFATIAEDPRVITRQAEQNLSAVLSLNWLGDPAWGAAVEAQLLATEKTLAAVRVVTNSTINMVGGQANIPISVQNGLTQPVTIVVSATPNNGRLIVNGTQSITIQPESQANARIPVQAQVGNGRVLLTVTLSSVDGVPVGEPAVIPINVRADWEGWGLAAVGLAFAALITAGVIRTLRRRKQGQSEDV